MNLKKLYNASPDPIVIPHADNERMPPRPQPILIPTAKEPIDFRIYPYKSLIEDETKLPETRSKYDTANQPNKSGQRESFNSEGQSYKMTRIRELPRTTFDDAVRMMNLGATDSEYNDNLESSNYNHMVSSNKETPQTGHQETGFYFPSYRSEMKKQFKGPKYYLEDKDKAKAHIREGRRRYIDRDLESAKYRRSQREEEEYWH